METVSNLNNYDESCVLTVEIDSKSLKDYISMYAYDAVVKNLVKEAKKSLPREYHAFQNNYSDGKIKWELIIREELKAFLEDNKDEIIERCAGQLKKSVYASKKFKETIGEIYE